MFHRKALHSVQYQIRAYKTAPGFSSSQLTYLRGSKHQLRTIFRKESSSMLLRFFEEFCRELGYKASEYQNSGFIPQHSDLSILKMFFFNLRSETWTMLDIQQRELHSPQWKPFFLFIVKVCSVWWPTRNTAYMISISTGDLMTAVLTD